MTGLWIISSMGTSSIIFALANCILKRQALGSQKQRRSNRFHDSTLCHDAQKVGLLPGLSPLCFNVHEAMS